MPYSSWLACYLLSGLLPKRVRSSNVAHTAPVGLQPDPKCHELRSQELHHPSGVCSRQKPLRGCSKTRGPFGSPWNKDDNIVESIVGSHMGSLFVEIPTCEINAPKLFPQTPNHVPRLQPTRCPQRTQCLEIPAPDARAYNEASRRLTLPVAGMGPPL